MSARSPEELSILVVVQPSLFRRTLTQTLSDRIEAAFLEAGTGMEALSIAAAARPNVAVIDPLVPGGSGLARALYLNDPDCAVVLLYRPLDRSTVANYFQAGTSAFVDPDCTLEELIQAVERARAGEIVMGPRLSKLLAAGGDSRGLGDLSPREQEVVRQVAAGKSNLEIARDLGISGSTVKGHLANIFGKLQFSNRVQLTTFAIENGLLEERPAVTV